jgi:hypothetical protein
MAFWKTVGKIAGYTPIGMLYNAATKRANVGPAPEALIKSPEEVAQEQARAVQAKELRDRLTAISTQSTDPTQSKGILEQALNRNLGQQQAVAKAQAGSQVAGSGALARRLAMQQGIARQENAQDLGVASAQERKLLEERKAKAQQLLLGELSGAAGEDARQFAIDRGALTQSQNLATKLSEQRLAQTNQLIGAGMKAGGDVGAAYVKSGSDSRIKQNVSAVKNVKFLNEIHDIMSGKE